VPSAPSGKHFRHSGVAINLDEVRKYDLDALKPKVSVRINQKSGSRAVGATSLGPQIPPLNYETLKITSPVLRSQLKTSGGTRVNRHQAQNTSSAEYDYIKHLSQVSNEVNTEHQSKLSTALGSRRAITNQNNNFILEQGGVIAS
jgi:hypothetical protein